LLRIEALFASIDGIVYACISWLKDFNILNRRKNPIIVAFDIDIIGLLPWYPGLCSFDLIIDVLDIPKLILRDII